MDLNSNQNYDKMETLEDVLIKVEKEPYLSSKRKKARETALTKGFTDEYHMEGWLYFNRLDSEQYSGYDVDLLHMTSSGESY
jgi:hypothetical protein